ncbi:MAG: transcription termination factor NusA [Oscillospiraceae bacterium]|nr:transcription termination factor NusA [Oscillospiraceae bacterium]
MSRAKPNEANGDQQFTKEFFAALEQLAEENNVTKESLAEKISEGILKAVRKEYDYCDDFVVNIDPEQEIFDVCVLRTVVDDEPIDLNEINIDEARAVCNPNAQLGERVPFKLSTSKFGRVAAMQAKQSIHHDVKNIERDKIIERFKDKEHEAVSATVQKIDPTTETVILTIDKNEVYLLKNEQIPGEVLTEGQIVKVYVCGIIKPEKRPAIKISRKHSDLVKRLFELEIPEIYDGTIEVKGIAREAGVRTKIAVCSKDPNVDPVGACIGPRRSRIEQIVSELNGEKIDIIVYDEDTETYVANALAPANVIDVILEEGEDRKCTVIVPNSQLSLAIGNKGLNARLAARLTGCKIDIKPENPIE